MSEGRKRRTARSNLLVTNRAKDARRQYASVSKSTADVNKKRARVRKLRAPLSGVAELVAVPADSAVAIDITPQKTSVKKKNTVQTRKSEINFDDYIKNYPLEDKLLDGYDDGGYGAFEDGLLNKIVLVKDAISNVPKQIAGTLRAIDIRRVVGTYSRLSLRGKALYTAPVTIGVVACLSFALTGNNGERNVLGTNQDLPQQNVIVDDLTGVSTKVDPYAGKDVAVTKQPVPPDQIGNSEFIYRLAQQLEVYETVDTNKGRVFYRTVEKNSGTIEQIAIMEHKNELIFVRAIDESILDADELKDYINDLDTSTIY